MGTTSLRAEASCLVSRHNSERDRKHDALWLEFCVVVKEFASSERFAEIFLGFTYEDPS